jgi:hypothetical protein
MNLKDCVGFSECLVLPLQRLVVGVILALVEKDMGERNFGFDSLKSRLKRYMEEEGIVAVCGTAVGSLRVHVISPMLHCSDLSVVCRLLRLVPSGWTPQTEESVYDQEVGTMERRRKYMDPK